ncbi:hypothetical protein ACJ5N2_14620 [Aeromonas salmonicida]|uniref:hypothetical protein n=1 Tax=Aeromonas salmonicida TaxID=645 RepID=UPI0038B7CD89
MSSPILEALPALHVTIIGVVAAFFSAFAIYAYQKVNDAKEKLDEAVKHCMSISDSNIILHKSNNIYISEDGSLNWDVHGKDTIDIAKGHYQYLDLEEKYNTPRNPNQKEPSKDEVIDACNKLLLLFTTIFSTYPFWNNTSINIVGQTEKVSKLCSMEFDIKRVQEMQRIVSYLCWVWSTSKSSLTILAIKGNEYTLQQEREEQTQRNERMIASMPEGSLTECEKQKIRSQVGLSHISMPFDFHSIFVSFFERARVVEREVIPLLFASISNFNTYNKIFRVKETTHTVIALITFNMLFGVLLPLVTLKLLVGGQFEEPDSWFSSFEYCILISTMYPYLWACCFLYDKVKKLKFS